MGRDEPDAGGPLPGPSQPGPSREDAVSSPPCPGINGPASQRSKRNPIFSSLLCPHRHQVASDSCVSPLLCHLPLPQSGNQYNLLVFTGSAEGLGYTVCITYITYPFPSRGVAGCKAGCRPAHRCSGVGRAVATGCRLIRVWELRESSLAFETAFKQAREAGCSAKQDPAGGRSASSLGQPGPGSHVPF